MYAFHIDITNGVISYDSHKVSSAAGDAQNPKQYFVARGLKKPPAITVKNWPFASMYLTHGNKENGAAIAYA